MTIAGPTVRSYMTASPHSIGDEQTIATAKERMRRFGVRHLPVLHGGRLVGVVSERDVALLESVEIDIDAIGVDEALTDRLYAVTPDEPIAEVAEEMARARIGSAVVIDEGDVVGIFTSVDACRALADLLRVRRAVPQAPSEGA